jgi:chromosome segregation ATPase
MVSLKAYQEQQAEIEVLQQKNKALQAEVAMLESQLRAAEDTRDMRQTEAERFFQLTKELRVERDEARHKLAQAESVIELGIPKEDELQRLRYKVQLLMEACGQRVEELCELRRVVLEAVEMLHPHTIGWSGSVRIEDTTCAAEDSEELERHLREG